MIRNQKHAQILEITEITNIHNYIEYCCFPEGGQTATDDDDGTVNFRYVRSKD